jgi:hypothetical protein
MTAGGFAPWRLRKGYNAIFKIQVPLLSINQFNHKVQYIYAKSTTVSVPSSEFGPPPFPQVSVPLPPPPITKGGGEGTHYTLACGWGVGESQFRRLEKKLSTLFLLCEFNPFLPNSNNYTSPPKLECKKFPTSISPPPFLVFFQNPADGWSPMAMLDVSPTFRQFFLVQ